MAAYKHVDEDLLVELYVNQGLTTHEVARVIGVSQRQTYVKLKRLGVVRNASESRKGKTRLELGHRRKTNDGYWSVYYPEHPNAQCTGYVLEHRFVMSQLLGRPLFDHEVVHHINENRQDNRPENLELIDSPGVHTATHHRRYENNDVLLNKLRRFHDNHGRWPSRLEMCNSNDLPSYRTYSERFGHWRTALTLASEMENVRHVS